MAIDRRRFLAGSAAVLLGAQGGPAAGMAARSDETFFSGRAAGTGRYQTVGFDGGGEILVDCDLPARCHAIAVRPDGAQCVAVARRPGTFAVVIDLAQRTVAQRLAAMPGRTFAGHAVFSADGRRLLLTEDNADREEGFVSVRAVDDGYRSPATSARTGSARTSCCGRPIGARWRSPTAASSSTRTAGAPR